MKVLVFEPNLGGHRLNYVKLLICELGALGVHTVFASTGDAFKSREFEIHLKEVQDSFTRYECPPVPTKNSTASNWQLYRSFMDACKSQKPDHTYVLAGGGLTQLLAIMPNHRKLRVHSTFNEGIHFGGGFGYEQEASVKKKITSAINRSLTYRAPWNRYLHVDPFQLEALRRHNCGFADRAELLPDPVDIPAGISRNDARIELDLPGDALLFGCAGRMDRRKGIDLLIEAFASALPDLPPNSKLLLFGKFEKVIVDAISAQPAKVRKRIIDRDRLLTDREFDLAIPAMDAVCAPYPRHFGSSGIVLRAIAAGRPVIGPDKFWIGRIISTLGVGRTCKVENPDELRKTLVATPEDIKHFNLPEAARVYLKFQSEENFKATLTASLRSRIGLPVHPAKTEWHEVSQAAGLI